MKKLIVYRLFDPTYGPMGNPKTLSISLRSDNTLYYSLYGGWQPSGGMGYCLSNLQLQRSLPEGIRKFKKVEKLHKEISSILSTGVGSRRISSFEILNDL
jgi:hypothetical protein